MSITAVEVSQALEQLAPGAKWSFSGTDLTGLVWADATIAQPTDAAITAAINAIIAAGTPVQVTPQDLMAQFTAADITTIQAAITSSATNALLWYAMLAQGPTPMQVTNARFLAGWNALVAILGQARMNTIATALNAPSLVV